MKIISWGGWDTELPSQTDTIAGDSFPQHDFMLEIFGGSVKISRIAFSSLMEIPENYSPILKPLQPYWDTFCQIL